MGSVSANGIKFNGMEEKNSPLYILKGGMETEIKYLGTQINFVGDNRNSL